MSQSVRPGRRKHADLRQDEVESAALKRAFIVENEYARDEPAPSAERLEVYREEARRAKAALQAYEAKLALERAEAERAKKSASTPRAGGLTSPRLERQLSGFAS